MWIYKDKELLAEDIPPGAIGFIYLITQLSTGRRYIGRKLLTSASSKVVNGKKKKVRKVSDWQNYWSSSPQIKEWIKEAGGTQDFKREVLVFCQSKGSVVYCEELSLFFVGALEDDSWLNGNIRSKIFRNWVKKEDAANLRSVLSKLNN